MTPEPPTAEAGWQGPEPCAFGWPEGCEYHDPDRPTRWCGPCSTVAAAFPEGGE